MQSTGPRSIPRSTLQVFVLMLAVFAPALVATLAATTLAAAPAGAVECPARGTRVVFARSMDAFGSGWGIATVPAGGGDVTWLLQPPKGKTYNFRPSVSPADGTILWDTNQGGRQRIRTMGCDGANPHDWSTKSDPRDSMAPAFSPDGTQVAFVARMPGNTSKTTPVFGLYVAPADHSTNPRLVTKTPAAGGMHPAWSPDGTRLAFGAGKTIPNIATIGLDGKGLTSVTSSKRGDGEPAWSPDGTQIAYNSAAQGDDVWIVGVDGNGARKLATAEMGAYQPAFSPDGQWVAYVNNYLGHSELWLIHPDGTEAHALTTTTGKEANEAPAF